MDRPVGVPVLVARKLPWKVLPPLHPQDFRHLWQNVSVGRFSVSDAEKSPMRRLPVPNLVDGRKSVRMKAKRPIGSWQTPNAVQSAPPVLRKIKDAIICPVSNANTNFAGFVWEDGRITEPTLAGTTNATNTTPRKVTTTNRMQQKPNENLTVICIITNVIMHTPWPRNLPKNS